MISPSIFTGTPDVWLTSDPDVYPAPAICIIPPNLSVFEKLMFSDVKSVIPSRRL